MGNRFSDVDLDAWLDVRRVDGRSVASAARAGASCGHRRTACRTPSEGPPKSRAGRRTVIVNRALCDSLLGHLGDRLRDREALVFTEPDGTPLKFGSFYSQRFKPAVRAVLAEHLDGLRFHDLRHTYASVLVEQGAHPKQMAELMGHSSVQITLDRYSHVMPRLTSALADRMDHAYRDAAPGHRSAGGRDFVVVELR